MGRLRLAVAGGVPWQVVQLEFGLLVVPLVTGQQVAWAEAEHQGLGVWLGQLVDRGLSPS